jgi:phosphoenolpyruvate---glycerone phosphotransferase subunit DhaL
MSASLMGAFRAVASAVRDSRDELNRLDAVAGDGDIGVTMAVAADAILGLPTAVADSSPEAALRQVGMEIARHAPSTAGTLVATALLAAARVEASTEDSIVTVIARRAAAAQHAIEDRGHANVGDKTMLDAIDPLVVSLETSARDGTPLAEALTCAASAARQGAEHTRELRARVGRAGWLADRSEGAEDAGAHLVALIAEAASRYVSASSRGGN